MKIMNKKCESRLVWFFWVASSLVCLILFCVIDVLWTIKVKIGESWIFVCKDTMEKRKTSKERATFYLDLQLQRDRFVRIQQKVNEA